MQQCPPALGVVRHMEAHTWWTNDFVLTVAALCYTTRRHQFKRQTLAGLVLAELKDGIHPLPAVNGNHVKVGRLPRASPRNLNQLINQIV